MLCSRLAASSFVACGSNIASLSSFRACKKTTRTLSFVLASVLLASFVGCGGGGKIAPTGTGSTSVSLVYPQTTITATLGQAITPDTPTVTGGTATSFSIAPGLPAGLSLNASTGTLSGTPTTTATTASYVVTATTSNGNATATLQIAVNSPAPTNLTYPQTTILGIVGQAITPDVPSVTGAVSSFSVSPALPAGLGLNPTTGTISGTPTTVTPQATYTVTATGSGGSTTALLSVTVIAAPNVLLNLGETGIIQGIRIEADRVLSADLNGHWTLWNYTTGTLLASGDGTQPYRWGGEEDPVVKPVDMAGPTAVVAGANNLQVLSPADGSLLSLIAFQGLDAQPPMNTPPSTWWQLASDGSYICIGSSAGLFVYSPTGQVIVSKPGDYSKAQAFAAPGKVMVAMGAAGQHVIETISTANGASSLSQPLSGTFNTWFVDGSHFLTNLNNTVWVYSDSAAQQAIVDLPTIVGLSGEGNWIWTGYNGTTVWVGVAPFYPLSIYAIGATNPSLTLSASPSRTFSASGGTIGVLDIGAGQVTVIDISGPTLSKTTYTTPIVNLNAYAASSPSQWLVGNAQGVLLDGAGLPGTDRYFGYGAALSIAGATNTAAISTACGKILMMDPYSRTQQGTVDFPGSKVMLSSDGSLLAALSNVVVVENDTTNQYKTDQTMNIYSLPSGSLMDSFPDTYQSTSYPQTWVFDFTLAASGTTIGRITQRWTGNRTAGPVTMTVTPISGSPVIWSAPDTSSSPILLSPDGTLIAGSTGGNSPTTSSNIIKNGKLVTAVAGNAVGWIDNGRLLVNQYWIPVTGCSEPLSDQCNLVEFKGAVIDSPAGVQIATSPIPALNSIQPVNSDWVYNPNNNAIYSLTSSQAVWTGSYPLPAAAPFSVSPAMTGAVAGAYVVYVSGTNVVVESYP